MARKKSKKSANSVAIIVIIAVALLAACSYFKNALFNVENDMDIAGKFAVHFIDVGQGDSILIQNPDDEFMLIDTGERDQYDKLSSYLEHYGVKEFKYAIFTHPHSDHIGSADKIVKNYSIGTLIMSSGTNNTKTFERLVTEIENKNLEITKAEPGMKFDFGEAEFIILAPSFDEYDNLNNYSVVIKMTYKNNTFLFTGDMEKESENEVLDYCKKNDIDLSADVLKVAHHGSATSSQEIFLSVAHPLYAVISCGKNNSYGHPKSKTLENIESVGATVLRTDLEGDIVIISDGDDLYVQKGRGGVAPHGSENDKGEYETEKNEE